MKHSIWLFVFASIFVGCKNENPSSPQQTQEALNGEWEEEFIWYAPQFPIGITEAVKYKTSTLTLQNEMFKVSILPPQTVLIPHSSATLSSDTFYTGSYKLSKDTLTFFIDGQEIPERFLLQKFADSLRVSALGLKINDTLTTIKQTFFLWGNSASKNSGIFKQNN